MTQPRARPLTPKHGSYTDFTQVQDDIQELYRLAQPKSFRISKTAPLAHEVGEGECVLHDDESTIRRVYYKINGALRYAALT